jgi:hypothetical protein
MRRCTSASVPSASSVEWCSGLHVWCVCVCLYVCACACVCVRACVRACVCVRACMPGPSGAHHSPHPPQHAKQRLVHSLQHFLRLLQLPSFSVRLAHSSARVEGVEVGAAEKLRALLQRDAQVLLRVWDFTDVACTCTLPEAPGAWVEAPVGIRVWGWAGMRFWREFPTARIQSRGVRSRGFCPEKCENRFFTLFAKKTQPLLAG